MAALVSDPVAVPEQDRRWPRVAVAVLALWCVVALAWAARPVTDAVPLTPKPAPEADAPDNLDVGCNSFLSSSARDDSPLPTPPDGFSLARTPCERQHTEGRVLVGLNLVVVVVGLAVALPAWRRHRPSAGS